jgi:hypothetical protein
MPPDAELNFAVMKAKIHPMHETAIAAFELVSSHDRLRPFTRLRMMPRDHTIPDLRSFPFHDMTLPEFLRVSSRRTGAHTFEGMFVSNGRVELLSDAVGVYQCIGFALGYAVVFIDGAALPEFNAEPIFVGVVADGPNR